MREILAGVATIHITSLEAAAAVPDETRPAPDLAVEGRRMAERVRRAVATLPEKERRLMELYYFADKNLEQAGAELGLSKSWACRLHARAVELLRAAMDDDRPSKSGGGRNRRPPAPMLGHARRRRFAPVPAGPDQRAAGRAARTDVPAVLAEPAGPRTAGPPPGRSGAAGLPRSSTVLAAGAPTRTRRGRADRGRGARAQTSRRPQLLALQATVSREAQAVEVVSRAADRWSARSSRRWAPKSEAAR